MSSEQLYIPLPDTPARKQIVTNLMKQQVHSLNDKQFDQISEQTDGDKSTVAHVVAIFHICRLLWV